MDIKYSLFTTFTTYTQSKYKWPLFNLIVLLSANNTEINASPNICISMD